MRIELLRPEWSPPRPLRPLALIGGGPLLLLARRLLEGRLRCPGCGHWIALDAERCPLCGRSIASDGDLWADPRRATSAVDEVLENPWFIVLGSMILASAFATALALRLWPTLMFVLAIDGAYTGFRLRCLIR